MARFKFGRPISLRWNGLLIEGPAETVFEIPDEYYEEFEEDIHPVEPTLVWLDTDEGSTLRARVTVLETSSGSAVTLSNGTPLALGTAAPGTGTSASRYDHVHPTTGLALSGHNHSGVYDPAGTAASAVSAHEAASDPHPVYLTDAEGDAQYSDINHTHTGLAASYTSVIKQYVKNDSTAKSKGEAVYISSADGTNPIISYADADAESTSSKTLGLLESNLSANQHGWVITEGVISGIDTSAATAGQSVWLSGTAGGRVYGSPPAEPAHSVYIGIVTKANASTGEIFVKVQNGYEINELHDVSTGSAVSGDVIQYDGSMWNNKSLSAAGISATTHNHNGTYANTTHSHVEGDVTNLTTDLAGKAPLSHTHAQSDVTNLTSTLAGKSDTGHNHNGTYDPVGTASSAISTHESAADPHPTYLTATEGNAAYATTGHSHSGLLPTGGTTGQVLSKVSGTNYDVTWSAASGGASLSNTAAVALGTAAAGTASEASRQDHVHPTTNLATLTGTETLTNKTLSIPVIDNPRLGYTTTVTSASTLTLTNTSSYYQFFTGSTAGQIVKLPDASTMTLGQGFWISTASQTISVVSSGGNAVQTISTGMAYLITCVLTSGTTAASWNARFISGGSISGTGSTVLSSQPNISSATLSGSLSLSGSIRTLQTSTTTSATPYTFTGGDTYQIRYTGTVAQTLTMQQFPTAGVRHEITNASSANITVNANAGGLITVIRPNETWLLVCNTANTTVPSGWNAYILGGGSPIGSVQAYLGSNASIPSGWLLCDGTIVSRTTYAGLFGVIGTTFGVGDGSTTFGLPDLTGHMLVGASVTASVQTGTGDSYLNNTWDHNHIHSHSTNPAATQSGGAVYGSPASGSTFASTVTGASYQFHGHSTDIAATTSDTDSTAMSTSPTQKRTRVNYIIKT